LARLRAFALWKQWSRRGIADDGTYLSVSLASKNRVALIDRDLNLVNTFSVGQYPTSVAFDGSCIWMTNQVDNTVTKLLASTGAVVGTYPTGKAPYAQVFDGTYMWVANLGANTVSQLLASTGATVATYSVVQALTLWASTAPTYG
jgi:hypothetical protein